MEAVDTELDRLISRRASQDRRQDPDELEEGYIESVRVYNAARSKERRAEWYAYHADQAERLRRTMEPLIALHEARAAALLEGGDAM
jgi:hypothetical protein